MNTHEAERVYWERAEGGVLVARHVCRCGATRRIAYGASTPPGPFSAGAVYVNMVMADAEWSRPHPSPEEEAP